jgi:hypothetical protein
MKMAGAEKQRSTEQRSTVTMGVPATQDSASEWRKVGAQVSVNPVEVEVWCWTLCLALGYDTRHLCPALLNIRPTFVLCELNANQCTRPIGKKHSPGDEICQISLSFTLQGPSRLLLSCYESPVVITGGKWGSLG